MIYHGTKELPKKILETGLKSLDIQAEIKFLKEKYKVGSAVDYFLHDVIRSKRQTT